MSWSKIVYIIEAEGRREDIDAFALGISAICKNPPIGIDVNPVATKFMIEKTPERKSN